MNKAERKDFMDRANSIVEKLANVLLEEEEQDCTVPMILYVTAKFTAGLLLGLEEQGVEGDIADEYTKAVKELMAIMGKDKKIEAIENEIRVNKQRIAELERKQEDVLRTMFNDYDGKGN